MICAESLWRHRRFTSPHFAPSYKFVIENLELDECILPPSKSYLFKFKNDDHGSKNSTRFAGDIDSRDIDSYFVCLERPRNGDFRLPCIPQRIQSFPR